MNVNELQRELTRAIRAFEVWKAQYETKFAAMHREVQLLNEELDGETRSTFVTFEGRVISVDAEPVVVVDYVPPDVHCLYIRARVAAKNSFGTDAAGFDIGCTIKRDANVITIVGQSQIHPPHRDDPAWTAEFIVQDDHVLLTVTGSLGKTVNWAARGVVMPAPLDLPWDVPQAQMNHGGASPECDIPPLPGIDYSFLAEHPVGTKAWIQLTQDMIMAAFSASIALASGSAIEVGALLHNPVFNCSYSRLPTGPCSISDGVDGVALVTPFTSGTIVKDYTKIVPNQTQVWTLTANGPPSRTSTCSKQWQPRRFWGVAVVPGAYDEAFIHGLLSSDLGAARQKNPVAYNAGPAQKCYYCYPSSYGGTADNFIDVSTGFPASMSKVATGISMTNAYGVTINYDVWESDNVSLGSWNLMVN